MGGSTLVVHLWRLDRFFVCGLLLLVISLTVSPVSAIIISGENDTSDDVVAIIQHMEMMEEKSPNISDAKAEVEKELRDATLTPKAACARCHTPGQGGP